MRVASDIGGTFTDLVYLDESTGIFRVTKSSSTPKNFATGVLDTLRKAEISGTETDFFIHGSTVIINALTERKGAKVGLITTRGFRDVLEIARTNRPDIYNMYYTKPKPFVPRYLRLEVEERLNYKGQELIPVNVNDVYKAAELFGKEGVEAVAVCFLHSYANPKHEVECGEIIKNVLPKIPLTLSHQITQEWREYERTSTAVLNAYVHPVVHDYLDNLQYNLGLMEMKSNSLHVMQSNGGSASFGAGKITPINLVESGPVAGIMGAAYIGMKIGEPNIIALDIGGTTAKTSLVENGVPKITTEYRIERRTDYAGYPIMAPTIDIVEIGAGGGSIAWIDPGGALRVGPKSAGAVPGPACYGGGGTQPTVTDANLLAGRINPSYFLGGEIKLNMTQAEEAVMPIADAFNVSIQEAAMGIIRVANANMINALKLVSIRRGYDPRDFTLVCFGGGGAMHAGALLRDLHTKKAIIPINPAVFSAWGMLMTDLRRDYIRTMITRTDKIVAHEFEDVYQEMESHAIQDLTSEQVSKSMIEIQRCADMRYKGQEHTVKILLPKGRITADIMPEVNELFHSLHEKTYKFRLDVPIELVNYHITAYGHINKPEIKMVENHTGNRQNAHKGKRRVNYDELGCHEADIYERDRLPVLDSVDGPAVIEEPASVTVVFPDQRLTRDVYGNLHIDMMK